MGFIFVHQVIYARPLIAFFCTKMFTACLVFGPASWFVLPEVLNSQVYLNYFRAEKSENKILSLFTVHIPLKHFKSWVLDLECISKYMLYNFKITKGKSFHRHHVIDCNEEVGNKRLQGWVWCFAKMKNKFSLIWETSVLWRGALFFKAEDRSSL